ncbi:putative prolyl-trna synthetase [Erysiphe necator]|uniref:proline--tRNA ligase n=1 Tax=Uncinula necator TaxID=52586 RepID=A0A0B1P090_UNCNE|nr:putative prolyl-trna synthetase [Erysiphe necator]
MVFQTNGFLVRCEKLIRQWHLTSREPMLGFQSNSISYRRFLSYDNFLNTRTRLSKIWIPTGGTAKSKDEDGHAKLIRAGFLRQAHSGIFHMLPLGLRVEQKLEALIDKHMSHLGASRLSLSSISSEELWQKSGRLDKAKSEMFHFEDRKSAKYLLSPTHEEEITSLVSGIVKSYKELPLRVYQITRKYRDEPRPRHGLFRSREFIMKDLYTFDFCPSSALSTYHMVRTAYSSLFNELKLPYIEAEADSGDMGGNLSHEFHFPTLKGEDHILKCLHCNYTANEEISETVIYERPQINSNQQPNNPQTRVWRGISKDRSTLINVWYESASCESANRESAKINFHAIKSAYPEFDPSVDDALPYYSENHKVCKRNFFRPITQIVNLVDFRVPKSTIELINSRSTQLAILPPSLTNDGNLVKIQNILDHPSSGKPMNLLRRQDGDPCPRCTHGSLKIYKAIELGHTFHLGTRYSVPLQANLSVPIEVAEREKMIPDEDLELQSNNILTIPMQMGCHGIGLSRMIGAVADTLADDKGLNWPRVMAPYEVVIISSKELESGAEAVYYQLNPESVKSEIDIALDDRSLSFPWKLRDADLIGYPVIIIVGRKWESERTCEVQCRQLKVQSQVPISDLRENVLSLLQQL